MAQLWKVIRTEQAQRPGRVLELLTVRGEAYSADVARLLGLGAESESAYKLLRDMEEGVLESRLVQLPHWRLPRRYFRAGRKETS